MPTLNSIFAAPVCGAGCQWRYLHLISFQNLKVLIPVDNFNPPLITGELITGTVGANTSFSSSATVQTSPIAGVGQFFKAGNNGQNNPSLAFTRARLPVGPSGVGGRPSYGRRRPPGARG